MTVVNRYTVSSACLLTVICVALLYLSFADRRKPPPSALQIVTGLEADTSNTSRKEQVQQVSNSRNHISLFEIQDSIADQIIRFKSAMIAKAGYGPGVHVVSPSRDSRLKRQKIDGITIVRSSELIDFSKPFEIDNKSTFKADGLNGDKKLYIDPANLTKSDLASADFSVYSFAGTYLPGDAGIQSEKLRQLMKTPSGKTGWTGLTRVFENHPVFGRVILAESDIAAAELSVMIEKDFLNAKVGEFPATLMKMRDESGGTMSTLRWFENNAREYEISVKQIDDTSTTALVQMAESISRSRR